MARRILLFPSLLLAACPEQGVKAFNAEPEAEITSHGDGDEVYEGFTETFRGVVSDPDHSSEDLTATWSLDGEVLCEVLAVTMGAGQRTKLQNSSIVAQGRNGGIARVRASSMRLPTKPKPLPTTTGTLPSRRPSAIAVTTASSATP